MPQLVGRLLQAEQLVVLALGFWLIPPRVLAQNQTDHPQCSMRATGGTLELSGFTVKLGQVPDGPNSRDDSIFKIGETWLTCQALVLSRDGSTVFEQLAYSSSIVPISGRDVNRDGEPDVVIETYSGGAHCCYTYYIVSVGRQPGLVKRLYSGNDSVAFQHLDGDNRPELLVGDDSFAYFEVAYAYSPRALLILHLEGSTFRDVGSRFPQRYDSDIAAAENELVRMKVASLDDLGRRDDRYESAKGKVLSIVINFLYSGRVKEARDAFDRLWHTDAAERLRIRDQIKETFCRSLSRRFEISGNEFCTTGGL